MITKNEPERHYRNSLTKLEGLVDQISIKGY